jgi:hypothetical protein
MTVARVTQEQILDELGDLDPGRWFEVLDFIGYLKHRATPERTQTRLRELTARELLQSELVGLWADREDIHDSQSFARQLRQQAEHRSPPSTRDTTES